MADRNCPSAKWWHLAKSLCGLGNNVSPTVAPLLNESQSAAFDNRAKADLLNDTFVNQNNSLNPQGFPYGPTHLKSVFWLKHIPGIECLRREKGHTPRGTTGTEPLPLIWSTGTTSLPWQQQPLCVPKGNETKCRQDLIWFPTVSLKLQDQVLWAPSLPCSTCHSSEVRFWMNGNTLWCVRFSKVDGKIGEFRQTID